MKTKGEKTASPAAKFRALGLSDYAVIFLCLAGIAASLNFFRLDLFRTLRSQNAIQAGTITFKRNTAQRRLADRVIWDRLRQHSPVYDGDIIRTAELSQATIHLPHSGQIDLDQNTLVQIWMNESGAMEIDLSSGGLNLQAGSGGGIVLNAGGSRVDASEGTVLNAAAGAEGLLVQVAEGSAVLSSESGSREAAAGTVIALDAAGTERNDPALLVYTPRPNGRILSPGREPVQAAFSWNRVNLDAAEPLTLEIAEDRTFTRLAGTAAASSSGASVDLPPGVWYWRVRQSGGAGAAGTAGGAGAAGGGDSSRAAALAQGRLTVVYAPAPALLSPVPDQVFRYRTKPPSLRFQWTEVDGASGYFLEAANNAAFSGPALAVETGGAFFDSRVLGAGRWYWRVRPLFSAGAEGQGQAALSSFTIEQTAALAAPSLIAPGADGLVNIAGDRDILFSWRRESEALSYTIRIASGSDLQNPVIQSTVRDNYYRYPRGGIPASQGTGARTLRPGRYYWAVYQSDGEGDSPPSELHSFTALEGEAYQRAVFPPDNYTIAETLLPDIRFTWKSNLPFETRFQIAPDAEFSRLLLDERVSGESARGRPLPPGTYYWRLSALPGSGGADTDAIQTPARRFIAAPDFPAPAPVDPPPNGRIIIRGSEPASFRWQNIGGAEYYQVRIYAASGGRPVHEQTLGTSVIQLNTDRLENGPYYWTIQAFADEGLTTTRRTGALGRESFVLRRIQPLTLDWPDMGTAIAGLTALRQPTVLRWSTPEAVGRSRFFLSRNPNPLSGPVLETANPGRTINLERLAEGTYYWTIQGETQDGFDISAAAPRRFQILPIPLLPPAQGRRPPDRWVMGPAELRETRNIVFAWSPVEGANRYIITVLREGDGEQLAEAGTDELSWTLEDLRILGRGNFVWRLEAVHQGSDGFVEQRGRPAESRFTLDVPQPGRLQPGETGTLYGR
ncbi:MAG: hypothetical protein LBD09_05415 [Treponema sp.]|jgi:hypothetical protein|nr:hypothetical protein [Treponema sp.]